MQSHGVRLSDRGKEHQIKGDKNTIDCAQRVRSCQDAFSVFSSLRGRRRPRESPLSIGCRDRETPFWSLSLVRPAFEWCRATAAYRRPPSDGSEAAGITVLPLASNLLCLLLPAAPLYDCGCAYIQRGNRVGQDDALDDVQIKPCRPLRTIMPSTLQTESPSCRSPPC